jgi:nicotinamide-nucleotide amidase
MIAEFVSVGTELLLGEIVDTNSAWLAADVAERGVNVYWSTRVGDNLGRIQQALEQALSRSDWVITCGGLGPTDDDMTREAICSLLAETPEVDAQLEADLRARFAKFSRHMSDKNLKQAWLIPSAEALPNPHGTAPGWLVRVTRAGQEKIIITLPGPPRELKRMWLAEVVPRLKLPTASLYSKILKTSNIGESTAADKLGEWTLSANPSVATYAKRDGVHVRIAARAETVAAAQAAAEPAETFVREALAGYIWGEDSDTFAGRVIDALKAQNKTLASLETVTAGMLAETLSVPHADAVFVAGVVAYNVQTSAAFGVPNDLIAASQAATDGVTMQSSKQALETLAQAQARAAAVHFGADYGLATSGHWQADSSSNAAIVAVYDRAADRVISKTLELPASARDWLRERVTFRALALLWFDVLAG